MAGKTFEEYEEAVDEMFSLEQEFYKRKIDELQKERNSISLEEAEQELEDYHNFVDLLHKKPSKLTTEEKRLIYDVYKSAKQEEFKFLKTLDEYDPDEYSSRC